MRTPYEKPVILKLQTGLMNKYGSSPFYARKVRSEIDGVAIDTIAEKLGSPCFVFSERTLRRRYREVSSAFSNRYPNVTFGWSYKTNYLSAICAVFHREGAIAEVVSEMEYDKARKLGIPGEKIIFNGPHKTPEALEKAAREGAMIHIDNLDEVLDCEKVAQKLNRKLNRKLNVGLRVNMDTGIYPQWSRFGMNVDSGQAVDGARRIFNGGRLAIKGLHCHIGTFILEPGAYALEVEKMVKLGYELEDRFGFRMEYYDIGGGFPSKSRLKGTYLPPDLSVPPIDEYAEKVTTALYGSLRAGDFPMLYIEAGRALVDEAGYLVTTVLSSKRMPDGRKAYVIDAGVNLLFTSYWYKFVIELDREVQGLNEHSLIYGPLCMNIDVVDEDILLPPLSRGTRLIVSPVGAYNVTQWLQFISYRPRVALVGEKGELDVIRDAEDLSDIDRREHVPARLRKLSR